MQSLHPNLNELLLIVAVGLLTILMVRVILDSLLAARQPRPRTPARSNRLRMWGGAMLLCILGLVAVAAIESQLRKPGTDFLEVVGLVLAGGLVLCAIGGMIELLSYGNRAGVEPPRASTLTLSARRRVANIVSAGLFLVWGMFTLWCMGTYRNGPWHPIAWISLVFGLGLIVGAHFGLSRWAYPKWWQHRRKLLYPDLDATEPTPQPLPIAKPVAPPVAPRACPKCAAPIAVGAPEGLCPRCLLQQVLPSEPRLSPTTGYGPFVPPTVAEVAEFFPQLEITGLIGQGGMGAVYLARQKALDRAVALKLIRVREDDPTFAERFVREAKAMARLSHPNIVTVHESGEAGGLPYLVMEYVDGVTLRDAMREKRLTPAEALAIIPRICDALEYAHGQGVVHRDVKPENILLDRSGKVKIADFGLAKLADPNGLSLTGTQQAMGTPHYMAPEQWERPSEVDHRADIYALGVVLYELLTGELPLGRFDPPSSKVQIDVRIDEVVLRALAKEPVRRYQHASDVKTALEVLHANAGWVRTPTFREYKSKRTLLGWPLVHVVSGRDPRTGRAKTAKGWVAVGDGGAIGALAIAGGWAVGGLALAGGVSLGIIAIAGGAAAGAWLACAGGAAAAGGMAVAGGAAAAGGMAMAGGAAVARLAVAGGHGAGSSVFAGNRRDADFGKQLSEWIEGIWDDYLWPF